MTLIPTVHISLPESVYSELRKLASSMGVQITDVIKMFIRDGLHREKIRENGGVPESIKKRLDEYEARMTFLEGKIHVAETLLTTLLKEIEDLKARVEELESPEVFLNLPRRGGKKVK